MIFIDDSKISDSAVQLIRAFGRREITHAIHDIDGTHSLIRDWPPVMALAMEWAKTCGLREDFDSMENFRSLVARVGEPLAEMDPITRFFNGYSAITQIEYGIRRAFEEGNYPKDRLRLEAEDLARNSAILQRLREGSERSEDIVEREEIVAFINETAPRFFRFYEKLLNEACRDKNTAEAWVNPEKWRVPGGLEFMRYLQGLGVENYFVTGSVVFDGGGMREEVQACGYEVGEGKMVRALYGSSWEKKMPKDEVMRDLFADLTIDPAKALIIGDGRTEIKAGTDAGCVTLSRLDAGDERGRELHISFGTNLIVSDYMSPSLMRMIYSE